MTAKSADNGTSAGDSGEWGWFTPVAKARKAEQPEAPQQPEVPYQSAAVQAEAREQSGLPVPEPRPQSSPSHPEPHARPPGHDRHDPRADDAGTSHQAAEADNGDSAAEADNSAPTNAADSTDSTDTADSSDSSDSTDTADSSDSSDSSDTDTVGTDTADTTNYTDKPARAPEGNLPSPPQSEPRTVAPGTRRSRMDVAGWLPVPPAPPRPAALDHGRGPALDYGPGSDLTPVREQHRAAGPGRPVGDRAFEPGRPVGDRTLEPGRPVGDRALEPGRPVGDRALEPGEPGGEPLARIAPALPRPSTAPHGPAASAARPSSPEAVLIRRTLAEIEPIADEVTSYFYALLFVRHPPVRDMFPASMSSQRERVFKALLTAAEFIDDSTELTAYLTELGRGHRKYGTLPEHYPAVGECLIAALTRYAPQSWSQETEAAWVGAYTQISQIMIDAAAEDAQHSPPWWDAEIVTHELRTPQIAVLTVRPDQPYPFVAGQYAGMETPWWPRVWRQYSFASRPRPDGLLVFHIKAVPAGWVSNSLVHRARPGDVLRLGPSAGSMTVDHGSDNGLVCLGGSTGIAPIKALVEDIAEHGRRRSVEVFYGARRDRDLYDMDTMLSLQQRHPWLSVRPVVSDAPTRGIAGELPDAIRRFGPWYEYDGYLSGPPGMIRCGLDALVGAGIPAHRIRHDSVDELVAMQG